MRKPPLFRAALLLLALLPGLAFAAAPAFPQGTWRLFKDSDGKAPRTGSTIELTLNNGSFSLKAVQEGETVTDTGTYRLSGRNVTFAFKEMEQGTKTGPWAASADSLVLPFLMLSNGQGVSTWMTPAALTAFLAKVPSKPSTPETMPALLARVQKVAEAFGNTAQRAAIDQRAKAQSAKYKGGEAEALYAVGTVYFLKGYYREAWYGFARAAVLQPTNAVYLTNLATTLQEIGSASDARTILEWVTKNYPNLDPPFGSLGTTCLQLKDMACARSALAKAQSLSPQTGMYDYALGQVFEQEGNKTRAQALYQSAFDKGYSKGTR
jgi:Flp pilus assembly protein TadD